MKLYAISNWSKLYENSRSRVAPQLTRVLICNRFEGENYCAIMAHPNGAIIFTAFILLVEVASHCQPRGTLRCRNGAPHTAATLAVKCHCPGRWFEIALVYLENNTDWLTVTETNSQRPATPGATHSASPAGSVTGKLSGAELILREGELKRVREIMAKLKGSYGDHQSWTDDDKAAYKKHLARKRELMALLGLSA